MDHPLIVTSRAQANKIAVGPAPGWREAGGSALQLLLNVVLPIIVGAAGLMPSA